MIPALPDPYETALREAIAYLHDRFQPQAIVASGTIIRGTPHASSDLDLVVIHDQPWRQRVQRVFHGVPAEMFVNPSFQVSRAFITEARSARPVLAHMLATGVTVHDATGIANNLQQEAQIVLEAGPQVDPAWVELRRYGIATLFEDAADVARADPERSRTLALQAMTEAVDWWFPAHGRWRPRSKALFEEFAHHEPDLMLAIRAAIGAATVDEALALAAPAIETMIGATGFFPWESVPESLAP